jgi:small subunit ribosomal protein S6
MSSQRLYETTFIVRPDLESDQVAVIRNKFSDLLTQQKAPQVRWESWGKRKLAYSIKKYPKGYYLYVLYLGEANAVAELERALRIDEQIIRFLTVQVLEKVDADNFDFDTWASKSSPLSDSREGGERDEASDSKNGKPARVKAEAPKKDEAEASAEASKNTDSTEAKPADNASADA